MKKILLLLSIFFFLFYFKSYSQKIDEVEDEIELTFNSTRDTLFVRVLDENVKSFEIFVYRTYEDVKIPGIFTGSNPFAIDISDWIPGVYHIKIDYGYVTQFRNIEIF